MIKSRRKWLFNYVYSGSSCVRLLRWCCGCGICCGYIGKALIDASMYCTVDVVTNVLFSYTIIFSVKIFGFPFYSAFY